MRVTLRNKKNIGLICFMLVSSSDFGLKSGLRILIWPLEVPFFWSQRLALLAKVTVFGPQKMALRGAKSKF